MARRGHSGGKGSLSKGPGVVSEMRWLSGNCVSKLPGPWVTWRNVEHSAAVERSWLGFGEWIWWIVSDEKLETVFSVGFLVLLQVRDDECLSWCTWGWKEVVESRGILEVEQRDMVTDEVGGEANSQFYVSSQRWCCGFYGWMAGRMGQQEYRSQEEEQALGV